MKNLWNLSLFKICIILLLSLLINNIYVYILCLIFLLITRKFKESILFIVVILLSSLASTIEKPYITYGIVETKYSDTNCVVDSVLFKTKLTNCNTVNVGDVISINGESNRTYEKDYLKKNILFINSSNPNVVYRLKLRNAITNRINKYNNDTKDNLNAILLNEYSNDTSSITFGFTFYYLYIYVLKKNKYLSNFLLFAYVLFFGFRLKILLILITIIVNKFNLSNINKLSFKIILILIFNKFLLFNNSFLVTLIISFIYQLDRNQKFYIMIMQSILFNCINPISSFLYKYIISSKIIAFLLATFVIIFPSFEQFFIIYINLLSFIQNFITIEIRGNISIISIVLLIILIILFKIKNQYIKIIILILLLITPINNPFAKVVFIDVGQGDSILIKDKFNLTNILIDTGSKYNYYKLKNSLYSQGIYKIDKLIITHSDEDHNGNIENLKSDFKINEIVVESKDIHNENIKLLNLYTGDYDNDNDNSLVYYLNFYGLNYLFTGDISKTAEKRLISNYSINVDVLKIGHHGSKYSTSDYFISSLLPRFAVISTNGMYSHPHEEVINILDKYQVLTLITKELGNVEFITTSLGCFIKCSNNDFVIINT